MTFLESLQSQVPDWTMQELARGFANAVRRQSGGVIVALPGAGVDVRIRKPLSEAVISLRALHGGKKNSCRSVAPVRTDSVALLNSEAQ